jgi:DNA-binding MarR family transcriptional regulator
MAAITPTRDVSARAVPTHATVLIARLARVVRSRFEQALAPLQLSQRDVVALSHIRGHGPTAQQALAERLCLDASSTVCLLNSLEDAGYIERRRDRADRRRALVGLTPDGEEVLAQVDQVLQGVDDEIMGGLETEERLALHALLARLDRGDPGFAESEREAC